MSDLKVIIGGVEYVPAKPEQLAECHICGGAGKVFYRYKRGVAGKKCRECNATGLLIVPAKPKPLLADARVGWIVTTKQYVMEIKHIDYDLVFPIRVSMVNDDGGCYCFDLNGKCVHGDKHGIISCEPPAAVGTAEWAIQRAKLGDRVIHQDLTRPVYWDGKSMAMNGDDSPIRSMPDLFIASYPDGWQIYEPQPEPTESCDNCKHNCTKSRQIHCHMYEPETAYAVGDDKIELVKKELKNLLDRL